MIWRLIDSGFSTGASNMETDLQLARECHDDQAVLRFYGWQPYCISLGANQSLSEIDMEKAAADGIDVVRRPTGGRAVLHAEELTYSVIMPAHCGYSSAQIYSGISLALVRGLKIYDSRLERVELETLQPDFPGLLKTPEGTACFVSSAKSEVKYEGRKLIGSAQRKLNNSILQHGSLLCGSFHKKITGYLMQSEQQKAILSRHLDEKTIDLGEILDEKTDYPRLRESVAAGFEQEWKINFR